MTIPNTTYPSYTKDYVDPSAASLQKLIGQFAVPLNIGARPSGVQGMVPLTSPSFLDVHGDSFSRDYAPAQPRPTVTQGDYSTRGFGGRQSGGQVKPAEMSSYDLLAEADELNIAGALLMPRPILERAVGTMRTERQKQQKNLITGALVKDAAAGIGGAIGMGESVLNTLDNFFGIGEVPGVTTARKTLATAKAKVRLSLDEEAASEADKGMLVGGVIGPMIPQFALWKGLQAVTGAAAALPRVGSAVSWLFSGTRGAMLNAGAMNVLWNQQFDDMPMLPDAEQFEASLKSEDKMMGALGAAGTVLGSRVGSLMFDVGLAGMFGRWQKHGATALPQGAQAQVVSPTGAPTGATAMGTVPGAPGGFPNLAARTAALEPPTMTMGPAGMQVQANQLVNTADGVVGSGFRYPEAEDMFGWKAPVADVAPSNMATPDAPQVRTDPAQMGAFDVQEPIATPGPKVEGLTAAKFKEQYDLGEAKWPEGIPQPAVGENDFPNWQNLTSARMARAGGTVLTKPDGSLIALVHEGGVFDQFSADASRKKGLTGVGAYFRDRMDDTYAAFSEQVGYGAQRSADAAKGLERLTEMQDGLQRQIDNMESALKLSGKRPIEVVSRIGELRAQLDDVQKQISSTMPQAAPVSHPVFAIVQKPYYFDAAVPRDKVDELLRVIETNDTFADLRPALEQARGEFEDLFKMGPKGTPIEPMGQQVHSMLGNLWKDTPNGAVTLFESGQVNQVLQAAGYDAIHNIGGMRWQVAKDANMLYNAWNILDPERQIVRVFAPPPMAGATAEQTAVQLTKQAAVMEGGVLPDLAAKQVLSDADVVASNISKYPYGVQVVRGVKEPGALMQSYAAKEISIDGFGPSDVRLVPKPLVEGGVQTYDVMVSTGQPISDKMVADYTKHGVFEGMQGVTGTGNPVEIVKVFVAEGTEKQGARTLKAGETYIVTRQLEEPTLGKKSGRVARTNVSKIETFLENRVTQTPDHLQDPALATLSGEYMDYVMKKLGVEAEDVLSTEVMAKMPGLMDEFLKVKKLPAGAQATVGKLVDLEIQSMAREMMGPELQALDDEIADAIQALDIEHVVEVPQAAMARGLTATREPGTPRWVIKGPSATRWVMDNDDAAMKFLGKYAADVQQLAPDGPVMPQIVRSGVPDTHFTMEPNLVTQAVDAEASATLAKAGIDEAKLLENLERDRLGGQFGVVSGPVQPASALSPLPPAHSAGGAGQAPRGSMVGGGQGLPPTPPPVQRTAPVVAGSGVVGGGPPPVQPPVGGPAPLPLPPSGQLNSVARNVMSIERELTSFSMQHVLPSSLFFDRMEELLFHAGAPLLRPGKQMETMRTLMSTFYNESEPHVARLTARMNEVSSGVRRRGEIWRALDLPAQPTANQPVSRSMFMSQQGFSQKEQAVVTDLENMLTDVYGGNKPLADRIWLQMKAYVNIVENNIVNGAPNPYRVPQRGFADIWHFVEHAERRQLRLEVPEAGNIMFEYLRSYYWSKNVKPEWDVMQKQWRQLSRWQDQRGERVLRPVADHVLGWMNGVENGFQPKNDVVINAIQSGLNMLKIPVTKQETMQLISGTMSSAYRALLGWNPASIIRDSMQFMGAMPWTGAGHLADSVAEVVGGKGTAVRQAVWQRAITEGWTELGIPPHPGTNVHQSAMLPGAPPLQTGFTPAEEARRELAQRVGDFMRDLTPSWLRSMEGTKLDPLWAYTNQGVTFRVVVANAAAKKFDAVMAQPVTIAKALREMGADGLSFAQQRNIEEALIAGQPSEARKIYANTVTNTVMNRYGLKEGAVGNHTVVGRVYSQLGGHSSHQLAALYNLTRLPQNGGGSIGQRAVGIVTGKASLTLYKMLGTMGVIGGALYAMQMRTGWNMMKMHPLNWMANPNMAGGPLKEPLNAALDAFNAAPAMLSDEPYQRQLDAVGGLGDVGQSMMKLGGAPAAAYRLGTGLAGVESQEGLMRFLTTGDRRTDAALEQKKQTDSFTEFLEGRRPAQARGAQ